MLCFDIDRGPHVFVRCDGRKREALAKEVEYAVAAYEAHDMVAAPRGLGQRVLGRLDFIRVAHDLATGPQGSGRCPSAQLAVAVAGVVVRLKAPALALEARLILKVDEPAEALFVERIELLDDPVAPRLAHRNEQGLHTMVQAQADQGTHAPRVARAAEEDHFVVDLLNARQAKAPPGGPDRPKRGGRVTREHRLYRAAPRGQLHRIQTVEAQGRCAVARPNKVHLLDLADPRSVGRRVALALGPVAPGSSPDLAVAGKDSPHRAHRRQIPQPELFKLPENGLGPMKAALLLESVAYLQDLPLKCRIDARRARVRLSGALFVPVHITRGGTLDPLPHPPGRVAERGRNGTRAFTGSESLHSSPALQLQTLLHALLQAIGRKRTVHKSVKNSKAQAATLGDVLALLSMSDVLAVIT